MDVDTDRQFLTGPPPPFQNQKESRKKTNLYNDNDSLIAM